MLEQRWVRFLKIMLSGCAMQSSNKDRFEVLLTIQCKKLKDSNIP